VWPGFVDSHDRGAIGYTYFLTQRSKGVVGTVYASKLDGAQAVADELLSLAVGCLKDNRTTRRIEAQIMPLNGLNLIAEFSRQGFTCHPRYYLELDLLTRSLESRCPSTDRIIPWEPSFLPRAAEITFASYRDQPDARLCADYCTPRGCESYLRSLIENPGCGLFLPEASFIGVDGRDSPTGFLISSRIARDSGMIPQVAILPSHQGRGVGNALMTCCLAQFKARSYRTVSLTVTKDNRRAFEWYTRLGFRIRKEFSAFVWER
jgi:ribosomal protein S18 acetylase RimI-like enzyme